jgi:hypothetical protein
VIHEEFLRRIEEQPEPEYEPTEFAFDPDDDTWHVVWDEQEGGRVESRCGRLFGREQVHRRSLPIRCSECAEQLQGVERRAERENTHFLNVERRSPVIVRDRGSSWIAPQLLDDVSTRAFRVLSQYSLEQRAHVFAVPGGGWELVPEDQAPTLADDLRLEERRFHELQ